MILEDLHVHTVYCDGKDTPEDIVKTAIEKGMNRIGFSGHSYTFFDNEYCMTKEGSKKYIEEINRLKQVWVIILRSILFPSNSRTPIGILLMKFGAKVFSLNLMRMQFLSGKRITLKSNIESMS